MAKGKFETIKNEGLGKPGLFYFTSLSTPERASFNFFLPTKASTVVSSPKNSQTKK
jgi:hypothetical protein